MPAAAVTPAPIAYIKVAAVKKLVVGSRYHCCLLVLADGYVCMGSACVPWLAVRAGEAVVSPFSHVCGEIPAGVGERQAVPCNSRVRRLVCMPLDALQKVSVGGWHVYFEQI